jgi:hypothetical protein
MEFDPTRPDAYFIQVIEQALTPDDLAEALLKLLNSGLSVWNDGTLYFTRARVERIGHLSFEVYSRDHEPPHFHVRSTEGSASFTLANCAPLKGALGRGDQRMVEWFFRNGGQAKLQAYWDRLRPGEQVTGSTTSGGDRR